MRIRLRFLVCAALLAGCSSEKPAEAPAPAASKAPEAPKPVSKVPDIFKVRFDTTKGPFVIEVHREWAPKGAERFYELIQDNFYDNSRFFRVVPNFVIQFGIAASPAKSKKWDVNIPDDPVVRTNRLGAVTYAKAGPNTRTTQVFINLRSNQFLDSDGFAPFGQVVEGMEVVTKLYSGHGEQPDQDQIMRRGNAYLDEVFPRLDSIKKATIL